jgi:hypothetical protein
MKKVKIFLKKLKKGDLDKPMISWGTLALKSLVCVHIIDNIVVIGLLYNNDDKMLLGLFYLLVTNVIVYRCLKRLGVM